ncbi:MAG: alanine racemase [Chloroflexota bacterium]|nr:alanine racemase [Chloroflexota bacterium]
MTSIAAATPPASLEPFYDRVRLAYGRAVGRSRSELVTPALVLDLPMAARNIRRMADRIKELPAEIRPHIKVHKSPELARMQVDAGAIGLSTATVWEAIVLARSGLDHLFLVNTVAAPTKIQALAELARDSDVMVAVDDPENAEHLAAAARLAGSQLGVLIEVDTGMDRCGVDTPEQALDLAHHVQRLKGLRLLGLTGYEGHCSMTLDRDLRLEREQTAMGLLVQIAELLEREGIDCPIRSAGGTATWDWTAAFPGVTEIQAGTYVVMDNFHGRMVGGFEHALTVQATVISRSLGRVIVDAGNKSMGAGDLATVIGESLQVMRFDEEHGVLAAPEGTSLKVGDVVQMVPGYSPSTVNWYDAYHVVENDVVIDIWPIVPRGPGHHGLIAR